MVLYQLPDGNWVDPKAIISIVAAEGVPDAYETPIAPRVIFKFRLTSEDSRWGGDLGSHIADCATYAEAIKCRDELAAAANRVPEWKLCTVDEVTHREVVAEVQADGGVASGDRGASDMTGGDTGSGIEFRKWT
jgi:hypothetical protein